MNNKALGALGALFVLSIFAGLFGGAAHMLDVEPLLARELVELKTTTVTCATSATQILPSPTARSMMIINTSATAVYVGGSDVDGSTAGTTGVAVCDGCTAGKTLSVDSRQAYCVVASGTQAVEILYGVN